MAYTSIQPVAFRIRKDAQPVIQQSIMLAFPETWRPVLKDLQAENTNRAPDKVSIPIRSLNRTLRAIVPDILSIERRAANYKAINEKRPWLYMQRHIDPTVLISAVHAWARTVFQHVSATTLTNSLKQILTEHIHWNVEDINVFDWTVNNNGTAVECHAHQYNLLPEYIASQIASTPETLMYGDHGIRFRRSSLPPGTLGAELVSWPPIEHDSASYSVVLTFTVQTVAFQSYPVIYCDMSIRRWAGPREVRLKQRTSVYLSTQVSFVPEHPLLQNQLQVASMINNYDDTNGWSVVWSDQLHDILKLLGSQVALIDAKQLAQTPQHGQQNVDQAAMIVHSTRMGRHPIGVGVAIPERSHMFQQLTELLAPILEPLSPYPLVKEKPGMSKLKILRAPSKAELSQELRQRLQKSIGNQLTIEICTVTDDVRAKLQDAIRDVLGLDLTEEKTQRDPQSGLEIQLTYQNWGGLTEALPVSGGKGVRGQLRDETIKRIKLVQKQFSHATTPTLILAEIPPADMYKPHYKDPKSALRIGLARTGRLVQFITADGTIEKEQSADEELELSQEEKPAPLQYRARNAVLDGLRQLGVGGGLPDKSPQKRPCIFVGIWLINKNSTKSGKRGYALPVLVRTATNDPCVLAKAPGFSEWVPYDQALLALAKENPFAEQSTQADYRAFIKQEMRQLLLDDHDMLLLCDAHNMRQTWPWVANKHMVPDALFFGEGENASRAETWSGLRIVRIRGAKGHETPEWYAEKERTLGFSGGLFRIGARVFASTHEKPVTHKYSPALSKAETWYANKDTDRAHERPAQPKKQTWNPGLYELTVGMLQMEDNNDAYSWAQLTHQLRKSNLHFDDATMLPFPLHLAKLMDEYILNVPFIDEDED